MTIRVQFCAALLLMLMFLPSSAVSADMMFGEDENIYRIVDVKLKGAEGQDLILGHKTTLHFFILGIYVEDDGYVLAIRNRSGQYYEFPTPEEVEDLQRAGLLPDPLPDYRIPVWDYLFGYSLWIVIVFIVLFAFWAPSNKYSVKHGAETSTTGNAQVAATQKENDRELAIDNQVSPARNEPASQEILLPEEVDHAQVEVIRRSLESTPTQELLETWRENNRAEYTAEAFVAMREILNDRKESVTGQLAPSIQERHSGTSLLFFRFFSLLIALLYIGQVALVGAFFYTLFFSRSDLGEVSEVLAGTALVASFTIVVLKRIRGDRDPSSSRAVS